MADARPPFVIRGLRLILLPLKKLCLINKYTLFIMTYLVDVVTEDSFYENLTLGLTKILGNDEKLRVVFKSIKLFIFTESTPGIQNVELDKRLPCERMQLSSWEQRHCCILPNDLRQFYLSTDGFKLTWKYEYAGLSLRDA